MSIMLSCISLDNVDYNEANTIHIINRGTNHFEPILDTMKTVHQENQLTHDDSQSRSEQQQLESRAKRVISNFNRPRSSSQVGMLDSRQQSATDTDFDKVNRRLEEFVGYFVKEFEAKLHAYHMILEGEVKKSGKFSDTFSGKIGQGVGAAAGGLVGLLLGSPVSGAKLGAKAGEEGGKKLGSKIGDKQHKKKITNLLGLVDLSQKDKANFRRELVEAGFDVFQSFEMQFMRVTTDQGTKKAIQQLAKDATNRAINYVEKKDASITEGVIFGKSKREGVSSISPGFEIKYEYLSNKKIWSTTNLYDKVGVLVTQKNKPFYHKKKSGSDTGKYGYRRLLISENWEKLKEDYELDNIVESKSIQFTDYIYILDQKDLKQKVEGILREINLDDKDLEEERMKKILEEVKDDIMNEVNALKRQSHQYTEDRKILVNIEANLKNLKIDEYLRKFKQDFEEVKQGQQKIVKSIEIGQEENRENFNQLSQKQDIHHDNNKREHKKTQEGLEEVVEVVKDNNKKINEIHEVVVTQKSKQTKETIWFDVKDPVKLFTGREEELDNLHIVLGRSQGRNNPTVILQMTSIGGLGGVGKSELARRYAQKYSSDYDNNLIWINAESEATLIESFSRLAKDKLDIATKNIYGEEKDIKSIVEEVYKFFSKRKSLFIFDNAENNEYLNRFLPLRSLPPDVNKPDILITSRNREWEGEIEVINLNELKSEESIEFVKKGLDIKDESQDKEIKALVEKLQHFPLAIQQAIAYIKNQRVTEEFDIDDYLNEYEKKTKDLLDSPVLEKIDNDYAKTTFTAWEITTNKIASNKEYGELALRILNIISYLAPENINREMFLSSAEGDKEKLKSAVRLLVKYSMINGEQKQSVLSIHRLVQEVTRLKLKKQNREEEILGKALELINNSDVAISHVTSIWASASKYEKLIGHFYLSSVYGESGTTPLHLLANSGNYEAIGAMLKYLKPDNINCKDIYGRTPLYRAAESGYIKVVELLVSNGADIHVKSADAPSWRASGWTVLHGAVYGGNKNIVEFLVNQGADVAVKDSVNRTPLDIAINENYEEIARLLDKTGKSELLIAASSGKLEAVKGILQNKSEEEKRQITNPASKGARGPLHFAANNGHLQIVELLIESGADINCSVENYGFTPLHMAASSGHEEVVKFLVEKSISINKKFDILQVDNEECWTVLHSAAKSGHTGILEYLINKFSENKEKFSIINAADKKGTTLLQTAAFHGMLDTVKFLVENKLANINAVDMFGATPLFGATVMNNDEVVEYLLKQKNTRINCDLEKVLGMLNITPLHVAVAYDNLKTVKLLIAKGSMVNAGEKSSLTPLHVAAFFNSVEVVKYLVDNGANTDAVINFSNVVNVLDFAKEDLKASYRQSLPYGHIIKPLASLISWFMGSRVTPGAISAALKYNNQLVRGDANERRFFLSFVLSLSPVKKQLEMIKDYVQNEKSGGLAPPIGENSIFYDLTNARPPTQCLPGPGHRKKRNAEGECLFTWEDVDEFNEEKDEGRDLSKIKIDSKKFIHYLKNLPEEKRSQLIQLASEVKIGGNSQGLVSKLTNNQKVMSHLGRVGRISGITMHGMMAKNVLADFLNGDYQGVAVNVGFIAGGQGFAKVAEAASLKGLKLAEEGKLLLGRSLRAASPFLARGTSAFVIYDLVNQIKAFKNGTEEALVGVVGDSIYLGVDAAEIGIEIAEAFEVLEGVSSVTGPIGATVGAVVFVGTDIYMAVKRVDKIDEIIHLTGKEKFAEGLRAFIGMQPEEHIQELLQEKQVSNQLVKQGLEYLKQHNDIQSYVFPTGKSVVDSCRKVPYKTSNCASGGFGGGCLRASTVTRYAEECTTKFEVDLDNTVLLDRRRTDIKWSRAKPDNPRGGQLFCLPQGNYEPVPNYGSYLCKSAIGITDLSTNKTGGYTLINLGEGEDYVKGFIDNPNIFVVNNGSKKYHGGNKDDIFILQGSSITGYFYGEGGVNTLDLTSFAPEKESIDVKLHVGQVEDYYQDNSFGMSGINRFLGRKGKADRMFITCDSSTSDIKFVDGQGSSERFVDHIKIDDKDCAYEMQIVVRPNTVIYNRALKGDFHYIIPYALGSAKVDFIYTAEALNLNNTFAFEYEPAQIKNIDVRNINVLNKTSHIITFNFSPMSDKEFNITISGASNPTYRLGNNTEIKVGNRGNLYMLENTNKSVDEIIKDYLVVANRLNKMSFFIQSLLSNETVAIGSGNYEVIHNNPLQKSHLVGNGGENVYVIDYESKRFETPLPEVVIYDLDVESSVDTIDLRNLVQQARGKFSNSFKLQIFKSANDLLLKATVTEVKPTEDLSVNKIIKHEYFTVRLKDGINWYNKTHVIMDNVPMRISLDNNEWSLKPQSLIFEKDKEVIVVTSQDIEENTELITPKRAGNYTFVCDHDSDLIVTNAFDTNVAKNDLCTIVLSKFYEEPKLATLSIKFADKEIVLKDKQKEISTARYVDVVKREHKEQVYNDVFNRSPEVMLSDQPHRHQIRHRRSTSGSARTSSWINDLFGWVKSSIDGLLSSALSKETSSTPSSISQVDARVDVNGTIMLLDVFIRKVTGQKYISTVDQPISPLEAQGYALNITGKFEKVVEQAAKDSKISMHRLNIDFVGIQKEVTGKIMSGKFNEISGILKSYVEKACPDEEAGKLSPKKFKKFIAQFNKGLLNQSIEQILHNRDGRLEVDDTKQMSLEPQSYLSNASVQSHPKASTCLSEIGVTKLGGNINR